MPSLGDWQSALGWTNAAFDFGSLMIPRSYFGLLGYPPHEPARDGVHKNRDDKEHTTHRHEGGEVHIVISHADCPGDANKLAGMLVNFSKSIKIEYIHEISPVVGCHLGPDTLLLSWLNN